MPDTRDQTAPPSAPVPPATASPTDETLRTLASLGVQVRDEADVRAYLERYSDTHEAVRAVSATARQTFGPEAALLLSVYHDPEIVDSWLKLLVRLPSYPPDFYETIRAVTDPHDDL